MESIFFNSFPLDVYVYAQEKGCFFVVDWAIPN